MDFIVILAPIEHCNLFEIPMFLDGTVEVFYKQPMFYVLGHFSKFAPIGSKRIFTDYNKLRGDPIWALAFLRPDQKIALILYNR